jgi:hypothetical protein
VIPYSCGPPPGRTCTPFRTCSWSFGTCDWRRPRPKPLTNRLCTSSRNLWKLRIISTFCVENQVSGWTHLRCCCWPPPPSCWSWASWLFEYGLVAEYLLFKCFVLLFTRHYSCCCCVNIRLYERKVHTAVRLRSSIRGSVTALLRRCTNLSAKCESIRLTRAALRFHCKWKGWIYYSWCRLFFVLIISDLNLFSTVWFKQLKFFAHWFLIFNWNHEIGVFF